MSAQPTKDDIAAAVADKSTTVSFDVYQRWTVDVPLLNASVGLAAASESDARAKAEAFFEARFFPPPPSPSQLAEAIDALTKLDQTKPATIGDVVAALKAIPV